MPYREAREVSELTSIRCFDGSYTLLGHVPEALAFQVWEERSFAVCRLDRRVTDAFGRQASREGIPLRRLGSQPTRGFEIQGFAPRVELHDARPFRAPRRSRKIRAPSHSRAAEKCYNATGWQASKAESSQATPTSPRSLHFCLTWALTPTVFRLHSNETSRRWRQAMPHSLAAQ